MRVLPSLLCLAALATLACGDETFAPPVLDHLMGEIAGEPSEQSVLLQSRLTEHAPRDGDVFGMPGVARFEVDEAGSFAAPRRTEWVRVSAENDFIVRARVDRLTPGTHYEYRLVFGEDETRARPGPPRSFSTLPGQGPRAATMFVAVSCLHFGRFRASERGRGPDGKLGFPALAAIRELRPDFVVMTGDNVYYDHDPKVGTLPEMRKKWHEQFVKPRFVDLFGEVATFWMKDDHDYRFDEADPFVSGEPSHELGLRVFREQAPILPQNAPGETYRTERVSRDLQIWLIEGRDYRSANHDEPGPEKTLWGAEQRAWLMDTLVSSEATFKIVISPTPMVGPDDSSKRDNHADPAGFRDEGEAFLGWAKEQGLQESGLYLVVGDRHWQYHSVHPTGIHEFSTGTLVDGNARLGPVPGDPDGTDPEALIDQPFTSPEATGGFLVVRVTPGHSEGAATLRFEHRDEDGTLLDEFEAKRGAEDKENDAPPDDED